MMFLSAASDATSPGMGGYLLTYGPLVLMFVVLYFLLIRPQQRRQKTRSTMLSSLQRGDKVVTIGGLHGTIMEITDDIVVIRVNDATKLTFDRSAVNSIADREAKS